MNEYDQQVIADQSAALTTTLINFIAHLDAQGVADGRAFAQAQRRLALGMAPERGRRVEQLCDDLEKVLATPQGSS